MKRIRNSVLLGATVILAACSTTPELSDVGRRIVGANAVYLAKVELSNGLVHYVITEVWRHDPNLGPRPEIGTDATIPHPEGINAPRDQVIVYSVPGRFPNHGEGGGVETMITPVDDGYLQMGHFPLDKLRERVEAGKPDSEITPPAHSPPAIEQLLARSHGIYLANVERSDVGLHYVLCEVWRQDANAGTAPAGMVLLPSRPREIFPGTQYGDQVVIFVYSRGPLQAGRPVPMGDVAYVFDGFVPQFKTSLSALRSRVKATPYKPAPVESAPF
jgi:hypothetical protein